MNIVNTKNYEKMSKQAAEILVRCLKEKPDAMFCIATGASPEGTYREFVKRVKEEKLETGRLKIIKLDEWLGLEKNNPATCEYYIREHILKPLEISEDRYISFNPMEQDDKLELRRISALLTQSGGIDCCVLGLGKNGHLGLNEPKEEINPSMHRAHLDSKTQTHSMLASNSVKVSEGYTLGIKDILASKEILFLLTGEGKQEAYEHFKNGRISSRYPANYLWLHGNVTCLVDESSLTGASR
jgi:galactosamine-6-phosphate isomerase